MLHACDEGCIGPEPSNNCTLSAVSEVFSAFKLRVNWAPGKTEAMIRYVGAQSATLWGSLCENGAPVFPLPDGAGVLTIVPEYKHVGSIVSRNGSCLPEARARVRATMNVWGLLAVRLFGSRNVSERLKLHLTNSLLFSRLYLAIETWTRPTTAALIILEVAQTRILRRIAGVWNHQYDEVNVSDQTVREVLRVPSVQCAFQRARLLYLGRIVRQAPTVLLTLCQADAKHEQ